MLSICQAQHLGESHGSGKIVSSLPSTTLSTVSLTAAEKGTLCMRMPSSCDVNQLALSMLPEPRTVCVASTIVSLRWSCTGSSSNVDQPMGLKYWMFKAPGEIFWASTSTSCRAEPNRCSRRYLFINLWMHLEVVVPAVKTCSHTIMLRPVTMVTFTPRASVASNAEMTGEEVRLGV